MKEITQKDLSEMEVTDGDIEKAIDVLGKDWDKEAINQALNALERDIAEEFGSDGFYHADEICEKVGELIKKRKGE